MSSLFRTIVQAVELKNKKRRNLTAVVEVRDAEIGLDPILAIGRGGQRRVPVKVVTVFHRPPGVIVPAPTIR